MHRFVSAAVAAVLMIAPVAAKTKPAPKPEAPVCMKPEAALAMAAKAGVSPEMFGRIDGDAAAKLIKAINGVGEPTNYTATTIIWRIMPGRVAIVTFTPCMEHTITMSFKAFAEVVSAVRGAGV